MKEQRSADTLPWYRQPLVWMLIAIPASSVVVGMTMLWLAAASYDGLVVDDYYKRGLEINRDLERDRSAERLGLSAEIALDARSGGVQVRIASEDAKVALPDRVMLQLLHPTRSGMDQRVELRLQGEGLYRGTAERLGSGRWHLQLETEQWRIVGRLAVPGTGLGELRPAI